MGMKYHDIAWQNRDERYVWKFMSVPSPHVAKSRWHCKWSVLLGSLTRLSPTSQMAMLQPRPKWQRRSQKSLGSSIGIPWWIHRSDNLSISIPRPKRVPTCAGWKWNGLGTDQPLWLVLPWTFCFARGCLWAPCLVKSSVLNAKCDWLLTHVIFHAKINVYFANCLPKN